MFTGTGQSKQGCTEAGTPLSADNAHYVKLKLEALSPGPALCASPCLVSIQLARLESQSHSSWPERRADLSLVGHLAAVCAAQGQARSRAVNSHGSWRIS